MNMPGAEYEFTVSAGAASLTSDNDGLFDLSRCVDRALYRAKIAGRHQLLVEREASG